jgi:indole-3-glycerol phosphate synthase
MTDFLSRIVAQTRLDVTARMGAAPLQAVCDAALARPPGDRRSLAGALQGEGVRVIAEIKRASPSRGAINMDIDPAALARAYEQGGAAALSVLTEPNWFKGSAADLLAARAAVRLPVLRKDFILCDYQVYESVAMGADAILLIVRILSQDQLAHLYRLAVSLKIDVLVEVHDAADMGRVAGLGCRLVGINNRDLAAFKTDVSVATSLMRHLPSGMIPVAASGIETRADIDRNLECGIRCFLIGEGLVRSADPAALLRQLRGASV